MPKGKDIDTMLRPISESVTQCYLGTGLHSLGLLIWLLKQIGPATVYMSTFSTSEEFLAGFHRLRKRGLIRDAHCLVDLKAARKTVRLERLFSACFDHIYLGMNHSKLTLVENEKYKISIVTSQNQTYGDRIECTMVTTDAAIYDKLICDMRCIIINCIEKDGLFKPDKGTDGEDP